MILFHVMRARIKNQQNKHKRQQQASRRMKPVPAKLAELIDLVNLIPPEFEMLDVYEVWKKLQDDALERIHQEVARFRESEYQAILDKAPPEELIHATDDQLPANYPEMVSEHVERVLAFSEKFVNKMEDYDAALIPATVAIEHCLNGLPKKFRMYVWQQPEDEIDTKYAEYHAMALYTIIRQARENLRVIIEITSKNLGMVERYGKSALIKMHATIQVDDEGIIRVVRDQFAAAVEDVEANRIKECAICRRIFWAGRITQQACSVACAHALRNRRYRAKYKEYLISRHMKQNETTQHRSISRSIKSSSKERKES